MNDDVLYVTKRASALHLTHKPSHVYLYHIYLYYHGDFAVLSPDFYIYIIMGGYKRAIFTYLFGRKHMHLFLVLKSLKRT